MKPNSEFGSAGLGKIATNRALPALEANYGATHCSETSVSVELLDEQSNSARTVIGEMKKSRRFRGLTSNPQIFMKAITGSDEYDRPIRELSMPKVRVPHPGCLGGVGSPVGYRGRMRMLR